MEALAKLIFIEAEYQDWLANDPLVDPKDEFGTDEQCRRMFWKHYEQFEFPNSAYERGTD